MGPAVPATVHFLVRDIVHPHPASVMWDLYQSNCLQGEVLAETDDGRQEARFLVVKVRGLAEPVIIRAELARPNGPAGERLGPAHAWGQKSRADG